MYYNPPLICDRKIIADTMTSLIYIGSFFGLLISSWIADNYGRMKGITFAWFFGTAGTILLGLSINIPMAALGFFLGGFGLNAGCTLHYVFLNE